MLVSKFTKAWHVAQVKPRVLYEVRLAGASAVVPLKTAVKVGLPRMSVLCAGLGDIRRTTETHCDACTNPAPCSVCTPGRRETPSWTPSSRPRAWDASTRVWLIPPARPSCGLRSRRFNQAAAACGPAAARRQAGAAALRGTAGATRSRTTGGRALFKSVQHVSKH